MPGRGLAVWAGGALGPLRARQREGALLVAWPGAPPRPLERAGIPFCALADVIGPAGLAGAERAGRDWARVWARLPLAEGRSFRELVQWRQESLLWTAEGFLRTATAGPRCVRTVELAWRLLEASAASELDICGLPPADATLLARAATARGVLCHEVAGHPKPLLGVGASSGHPSPLRRLLAGLSFARASPAARRLGEAAGGRPCLLVLLARSEERRAQRQLLEEVAAALSLQAVILPESLIARFETRSVRRAAAEAERGFRELFARLRGTPALAASYVHRGVAFADLAGRDLEALLLGRLPRAVRLLESALALVGAVRPAFVLVVTGNRDERRTLGMAAAAGAPWAALRPEEDEAGEPERVDGGPHPVLTIPFAPGRQPAELAARLRETVRGRVGAP